MVDKFELTFEGKYLNGKKWYGSGYNYEKKIIYSIKDGKGFIKEYNNYNKLIFEGEYVNGERNGKGKEYDNGKLKYEGEYLNGERNGKVKEYYGDGKLKFKGEYLNGKKWSGNGYNEKGDVEFKIQDGKGFIKEYNKYGKLNYEGEYSFGKLNGKGKEYNHSFINII